MSEDVMKIAFEFQSPMKTTHDTYRWLRDDMEIEFEEFEDDEDSGEILWAEFEDKSINVTSNNKVQILISDCVPTYDFEKYEIDLDDFKEQVLNISDRFGISADNIKFVVKKWYTGVDEP